MGNDDASPSKLKGRGTKARRTRIIKRETYSRRDFKGYKSGEEIYDTITKLIEEERIEAGKREGIYCTVYKHLQANARKSMNFPIHEMTPDLGGADSLGTKELLAVLLSISRREVDKLVSNSTQELKVDVFVELSEGECALTRFPVRYYTTTEDLIGYVLKDRGVSDNVLDYQLAVVKTPFKGKSKIKSIMCAVGTNQSHSLAGKQVRTLYPNQYPLHELGDAAKVVYNNADGIPRVVSCYFYVTSRDAEPLTVYHRRTDGQVDEETLYLRPSAMTHEIIEQCMASFDLTNDPMAYKLIMKSFEFDEKSLDREEQPLILFDVIEDCQEGYPQIWIEDQEVEEVTRTNSFIRKHSSRRGTRKKARPADTAETPALPLAEDDLDQPKSSTEISRIQNHLYHASLRRKTQSVKDVSQIKEQESHLNLTMVEQDKIISALNTAVATAEKVTVSPQNSIKTKEPSLEFETKLKQALAEKQTQIWELEEHRIKDKEALMTISKTTKSLEVKYRDLEDKFRQHKLLSKNDLEIEKREKRELEKEIKLVRQSTIDSENIPDLLSFATNIDTETKMAEMKLQIDKDQEIIDLTTQRNAQLKQEIRDLKKRRAGEDDTDRLEVDGLVRSSMNESISINDFTEWSKDLDSLKKRNDQLLFRNKQLSADNVKLSEVVEQHKSEMSIIEYLKNTNHDLKESIDDLNASLTARDAEISSLNERISGIQEDASFDDYQEKYYDLYEKNQHLESLMGGTIDKLKSKIQSLEDEKVQFQNTINGLNTNVEGKKRQLKEYDYMKNRVEMMEMEHLHLKEFSSQLIEENKSIDSLNIAVFENEQRIIDLEIKIKDRNAEIIQLRGLEKVNSGVQADDPRIEELSIQLEESLGKVDSRNKVVENMNNKIFQKEDEIANMKGIVSDFEKTNEFMTTEMQKLQKQNTSFENKIANRTEEISNFKTIIDALNEQISANSTLCNEENCSSAVKLKEEFERKLKDMKEVLSDSKVNFDKYSSLTGQLMTLQTKYEEMEDDMSIMEADKADVIDECHSLEKSMKDKETKVSELLDLTSSLRDEVDNANGKITDITCKRDELAKELISSRQKKADIELELNEAQEEVRSFKRKVRQSKEQAESLQNLNDAITAQLTEIQSNDCSRGKCQKSLGLLKTLETKDEEKNELVKQVADLQYQRKDLQNVVIQSKNALAEKEIDYQEMEETYLGAKETADSYRAQVRSLQRKLDPKKLKGHVDNLENQLEMYQAEVSSLKSVTRNFEDEIERMSVVGQESGDQVYILQKRNSSLDLQLGDAKGEIYDLQEQLQKFKNSLRESQEESAIVDTYLSEREMLKTSIQDLEEKNKAITEERDEKASALTALREELSIVKGVRDIQTRGTATIKHDIIKSNKEKDELRQEVVYYKESLENKENECERQIDIIERHKTRTRETERELNILREQLQESVNGIDFVENLKSSHDNSDSKQQTLDDLNVTIADLSATVQSLTEENRVFERSIKDLNEEDNFRQDKISGLESQFQQEVEQIHDEYKDKICKQQDELKDWVNRNRVLSEEILILEQQKEDLEKKALRNSQISDQFEMQDTLQEVTNELQQKREMAEKSLAQYQEAQIQLDSMESEIFLYKKKCSSSEKTTSDLQLQLHDRDTTLDEYKQRLEDMKIADDNKRTEIRLLNKMIKEYTAKGDESELEYGVLKRKYKEKKTRIEHHLKDITQLKNTNVEYENVIVALESTSATDSIDNSAKSHKIKELEAMLSDTEAEANQKLSHLDTFRCENDKLVEQNGQLVEEVKSYQYEWRRLTSLLNNVNHTNHANMDSCKRLEDKLEDIEFKVTEANVHIDVCEGDMFSKTEALVRENAVLEQKIAEKSHSLEQSENFLRESHENVNMIQRTMTELHDRVEYLQHQLRENASLSDDNSNDKSVVELQRKVRTLTSELSDKEQLLVEARSEKEGDDSAFKVSLDTIVRSYELKIEKLVDADEQKSEEVKQLQTELKFYQSDSR